MMTLEYSGLEQSLADWGFALSGCVVEEVSLRPSTLRLSRPGGALSDAPIFPYEARVILRAGRTLSGGAFTGGNIEFVGYRQNTVLDARPAASGVQYSFVNAWYYLAQTPYQQSTASWDGGTPLFYYPLTTDVTLMARYTFIPGSAGPPVTKDSLRYDEISNGEQIRDILQHCLDYFPDPANLPFEIGQIDANVPVPSYQVAEITCADAIIKCLELSPDVTCDLDYSTLPPLINFRSKANRVPVTLTLANGVDHKSIKITPRYDLVPVRVIIHYRYHNSVNGLTFVSYSHDCWPDTNPSHAPLGGPGLVIQTIDLQGRIYSQINAVLRVLACDPTSRTWWAAHHPEFADTTRFPIFTLSGTTMTDEATGLTVTIADYLASYPNELLDTVIADWMMLAGAPVVGKTVRIDSKLAYQVKDTPAAGGALLPHNTGKEKPISTRIVLTNGIAGTYTNIVENSPPEATPDGIARKLYESLSLQYEGEHIRVEEEVTTQISLANTLCLSGGASEWATMEAQLQSIRKDYGLGETSVSIGPARQLSAGDLRAVQFFNRHRQLRIPESIKTTGFI